MPPGNTIANTWPLPELSTISSLVSIFRIQLPLYFANIFLTHIRTPGGIPSHPMDTWKLVLGILMQVTGTSNEKPNEWRTLPAIQRTTRKAAHVERKDMWTEVDSHRCKSQERSFLLISQFRECDKGILLERNAPPSWGPWWWCISPFTWVKVPPVIVEVCNASMELIIVCTQSCCDVTQGPDRRWQPCLYLILSGIPRTLDKDIVCWGKGKDTLYTWNIRRNLVILAGQLRPGTNVCHLRGCFRSKQCCAPSYKLI